MSVALRVLMIDDSENDEALFRRELPPRFHCRSRGTILIGYPTHGGGW
jgi:hypothetical protein